MSQKFSTVSSYLILVAFTLALALVLSLDYPASAQAATDAPAVSGSSPAEQGPLAKPKLPVPPLVLFPASVAAGEPFLLSLESDLPLEGVVVEWQGKQVPLLALEDGSGRLECLLAVPLNSKDKEIAFRLVESTFNKTFYTGKVRVTQRDYPAQELTVEPKYVTPDPKTTERAQAEAKRNRAVLAVISPERNWQMPLLRPVRGIITSEYGFKRVFNGQPRSQHRGVDLRGAEGTPILSCADGVVRLAEEQHYSGNFVIIDHGLGVFSMYAHLSAFKVGVGDMVKRGQTIGLVGMTGRVTGPHLHFGLSVLGESVTPEPLMPDFR
jgi:murein DD-endopeptidase MepM/ murein hydrolase activator NlpD